MRVSIITVSFNSAATIEDTIKSVLSQSHPEIEYIIIDGGSTDATMSVVEKYKDKISRIVSEKDKGIYDAMNKGIKLASGEIVGILNSDDVYVNVDVVARVARELESSGKDIAWGDLVYVKRNDLNKVTRTWGSSEYKSGIFQGGWQVPHPSLFVRKSIYDKFGLYRIDLPISADYEMTLRLLEKDGVSSVYIPQVLVKMREGGNSNWRNLSRVMAGNREVRQAWKLNNLSIPSYTIFLKILKKLLQTFR